MEVMPPEPGANSSFRRPQPSQGIVLGLLRGHREASPDSSSNASLITMPPTTSSLKTHTGHGHKSQPQPHLAAAEASGGRSRHHSGGHRKSHHHRANVLDLSPGCITTPTPVQQSSEVGRSRSFFFYIPTFEEFGIL